jgi:hypothetical protein
MFSSPISNVVAVVSFVLLLHSTTPSYGQELASGTTVVAIVTENEAVVASDSQGIGAESGRNLGRSFCKVKANARFVVAASGVAFYPRASFDLLAMLTEESRETKRLAFNDITVRTETRAKDQLLKLFKYLYAKERVLYEHLIKDNPGVSLMIAGMDGKKPNAVRLELQLKLKPATSEPEEIIRRQLDTCHERPCILVSGKSDEIEAFNKAYVDALFTDKVSATDRARFMVTYEALVRSDIGTPVDIARISTQGVEWVERKRDCVMKKNLKR